MIKKTKKNKKALAENVGSLILILVVSLLLIAVTTLILTGIRSKEQQKFCRTQIDLAAKGKAVGFHGCHEYVLVFKDDKAIKYDLFTEKFKEADSYDYAKEIRNLKLIGLDIPENKEIENAIYSILAKEMKLCDEQYFSPTLYIGNLKTKYTGTVCKPCTTVIFESEKLQNKVFTDFTPFLSKVPTGTKKTDKPFLEYFKDKYSTTNEDQIEVSTDTTNLVQDILIGSLKFLGTGFIVGPIWIALSKDPTVSLTAPKDYNMIINTEEAYDITYVYSANESKTKGVGLTGLSSKVTLNPLFVSILDLNSELNVCNSYLGLG